MILTNYPRGLCALAVTFATLLIGGCDRRNNHEDIVDLASPATSSFISGLKYQLSNGDTGFTDANGLILPSDGQTVQFFMGQTALNEPLPADAASLMSWLKNQLPADQTDLNELLYRVRPDGHSAGLVEYSGQYVASALEFAQTNELTQFANKLSLIASFDNDSNLANGIEIEPEIHQYISNISFQKDLYDMHDQNSFLSAKVQGFTNGLLTSKASPSAASVLSWFYDVTGNETSPMWLTLTQTYNNANKLTKQLEQTYSDEGYRSEWLSDNDGDQIFEAKTDYTYSETGQYLGSSNHELDNGEWLSTGTETLSRNDHGVIIEQEYDYGSISLNKYTVNDFGKTTLQANSRDGEVGSEYFFSYFADGFSIQAQKNVFHNNTTTQSTLLDENQNVLININDAGNDYIAETATVNTYNDQGNITESKVFNTASYEQSDIDHTITLLEDPANYVRKTSYAYDEDGQLITQIDEVLNTCVTSCFAINYSWSYENGQVIEKTRTYMNTNGPNYVKGYSYDTEGVLTQRQEIYTGTQDYTRTNYYNEKGLEYKVEKDSDSDGTFDLRELTEYNEFDQKTSYKVFSSASDMNLYKFRHSKYQYNATGQLVSVNHDYDKDGVYEVASTIEYSDSLVSAENFYLWDDVSESMLLSSKVLYQYEANNFNLLSR